MIPIKEFGIFTIDKKNSKKATLKTFFTYRHIDGEIILLFEEQKDGSIVISDNGETFKHSVFERDEDLDELIDELCEINLVEVNNDVLSKTIENPEASEEYYFMEIAGFIQTCLLVSNLV